MAARIMGMVDAAGSPPTKTTRLVDNRIGSIVDSSFVARATSGWLSLLLNDVPISILPVYIYRLDVVMTEM